MGEAVTEISKLVEGIARAQRARGAGLSAAVAQIRDAAGVLAELAPRLPENQRAAVCAFIRLAEVWLRQLQDE